MTDPVTDRDLHHYFELFKAYQEAEDSGLVQEMDRQLVELKDRFHKEAEAVLALLKEKEDEFTGKHKEAYNDLVFDLQVHLDTLKEIAKTHTYDGERDRWIPKDKP